MLSYFFYITYFLICFSSIYFARKHKILLLFPLIFTSHFNVTSFFKVGLTISFFELNLFFVTGAILVLQIIRKTNFLDHLYFRKEDKVWLLFIVVSLLSIFVAFLRVNIGNLKPDIDFQPVYYARSIMSLNKFFFYFPCFYIIRSYLMDHYDDETIRRGFLKAMALSGLLPVLATIIQFLHIGFTLIHNNPSFGEVFRIEHYLGGRPAGLTNEASFFVYQLFFSTVAVYYGFKEGLFNKKQFYILSALALFGVIVSISRTGLLIFALFYIVIWLRDSKIFTFGGFLKLLKFVPIFLLVLLLVSQINIDGFNIGSRILSSFRQEADYSTLERYGSSEALLRLGLDRSRIFGIGIYNYQYYVKSYLPSYMNIFYYGKGVAPASFNFIIQLFVEFGLIFALIFFYKLYKYIFISNNDRFYKDWFLFLFIFSCSFQTLNFAIPFLIFFYPSKICK